MKNKKENYTDEVILPALHKLELLYNMISDREPFSKIEKTMKELLPLLDADLFEIINSIIKSPKEREMFDFTNGYLMAYYDMTSNKEGG